MHAQRGARRRRDRAASDADSQCRGECDGDPDQYGDGRRGGGDVNTGNNTATDSTQIGAGPDLVITKTHAGNFSQGQTGATYTITVNNVGGATTIGAITVTDTLPGWPHGHSVQRHGLDLHHRAALVHAQRRDRRRRERAAADADGQCRCQRAGP